MGGAVSSLVNKKSEDIEDFSDERPSGSAISH